jgi:hypothetical protein
MARVTSKTETVVGGSILFVLAVIAVGVFLKQYQFSAAILPVDQSAQAGRSRYPSDGLGSSTSQTPKAEESPLLALATGGLKPLRAVEKYNIETLSDKIDGEAELYCDAGFVGMQCQRFGLGGNADSWFEAFLYDMGTPRNAFTAFSEQRRRGSKKLQLGDFAYCTSNALFLAHGRYYVELVGASEDKALSEAMLGFAQSFVSKTAVKREPLRELSLFPTERLHPDSIILNAKNAFGFDGFANVFSATYDIDGKEVTAFLALRASNDEATKLAQLYYDFLTKNGGTPVPSPSSSERMVDLMGTFEVIAGNGNFVLGVHAADSKDAALKVYQELRKHLAEVAHE